MNEPTVILHIEADGSPMLYAFGNPVRVIWVDDRAPNDRVYLMQDRRDDALMAELIGNDPVGHADDGVLSDNKKQAIRAMTARLTGEPLKLV